MTSPRLHVLEPSRLQRTRWKNDGGWTTELARSGSADDFRWRVSIADIEADGPFSSFPGVDRDLLLLEGNGIELDFDSTPTQCLQRRFERMHFAGEAEVYCRLLAGPTRDFNVMVRRDAVRAEVAARPLVGPMLLFPEPGIEWLIHIHSGHASVRAGTELLKLDAGASLQVSFDHEDASKATRLVLEGAGELLFAKFVPVATTSNPTR